MGVGSLAARRAVEHALAGEALEPFDGEAPPRHAAGEDDGPGAQHVAAVQPHLTRRGVDARDLPGHEDLGAEPPRLLQGSARQLGAGHAGGEAEVVLDARRRAGLAAGRLALDHDRPQTLGRAVDGGRKAGRAGADDDRVVLGGGGFGAQPQQFRDAAELGLHHGPAPDEADDRAVVLVGHRATPHLGGVGRLGAHPPVRDLVPLEEVTELRAPGVRALAEHDGARRRRFRRDALQPSGAAHAVRGQLAHLTAHVRRDGGHRVVVARLDAHHARLLRRAEPDREHRPQRDRHLAEDVARAPLADDPVQAVDRLDRLDAAVDQGEEGTLVTLLRRELARQQRDVRRHAREPLASGRIELGEDRDTRYLIGRDHVRTPRLSPSGFRGRALSPRGRAVPGTKRRRNAGGSAEGRRLTRPCARVACRACERRPGS